MDIEGRLIGPEQPMYVIAELSANHGQDFDTAAKMIEAAADAGADAVKLQTYTPDTITMDVRNEHFRVGTGSVWEGRYLYDLYEEAFTPWEWHPKLAEIAGDRGLHLFSSPFDQTAVEFLQEQHVPAYKIASFELLDHHLLRLVAQTGKPIILSTGMALLAEIAEAMQVLKEARSGPIALLRCNSGYPALPSEMDLRTIPNMAETFDVPIGLSDHTLGIEAAVVARTLGACILEKHFVLDRSQGALDAKFSLEPEEFGRMVEAVRTSEDMLGGVRYGPTPRESHALEHRRSLFIAEDLEAGDALTSENVRSIRPGHGIAPKFLSTVLGATVRTRVAKGTPLTWDLLISPREDSEVTAQE